MQLYPIIWWYIFQYFDIMIHIYIYIFRYRYIFWTWLNIINSWMAPRNTQPPFFFEVSFSMLKSQASFDTSSTWLGDPKMGQFLEPPIDGKRCRWLKPPFRVFVHHPFGRCFFWVNLKLDGFFSHSEKWAFLPELGALIFCPPGHFSRTDLVFER